MDQSIDVYSQDFDQQYIDEEEILKRMEHFNSAQPDPLFLPLRAPGGEFWPSLKEQDDKRRRAEDLKDQLVKIENEMQVLFAEEKILNDPPKEGEGEGEPAAEQPAPRT